LPGSEGTSNGADKMLVKPMNTQELLRQLEALLVTHEDKKRKEEAGLSLAASSSSGAKKTRKSPGQKLA
jgi:DNA-binding response OmpR family regulator